MVFRFVPFVWINKPQGEQLNTNEGHFYKINGITYPSITTVLKILSRDGIQRWRDSIGWENADKIQNESIGVGNDLHNLIHNWLNNFNTIFSTNTFALGLFNNFKPELGKIDNIRVTEEKLFSPDLQLAGTVDCIADYDGIPSIIDFKNSRKPKTKSRVKSYLMQVAAYSVMWYHCTGEKIEQGVVMIANWDGTTTIFKIKIDDYISPLWDVLIQWEQEMIQKDLY